MELMSAQFDAEQAAEALAAANERVTDLTRHLDDSHDHILSLESRLAEADAASERRVTQMEDQVTHPVSLRAQRHKHRQAGGSGSIA